MSLHALATHMAQTGRGPDSMLVHMSPREVQSLQALAKANGGELTINPHTGLPEAGFLEKLLPAIAGAAAMYFTGGAAAPEIIAGMSNPATLGLGAAALGKASGKSVAESIQLGMGVYGGAGLAGLASTAGTAAISAGATPAIVPPVVPTAVSGAETALAGGLPSSAANSAIDLGGFDPTKGLATPMPNAVTADATFNIRPPIGGSEYKLAEAYTPPPAAPVPAPAAPAAPAADVAVSPSGINTAGQNTADASLLEGQQQRAVEKALADAGPGETMGRGLKAIASSPGKYMNMGTAKMGLAALAPALMGGSKLANKPAEGNIREFDFDPITGKYRKLRTTPVSQYNAEGMARGGVTSLLSFADGGATYSQADLDAIDAAIASANDGSKTDAEREAIRDKMLSSYSADALAAAPSLKSLGYNASDYSAAQANLSKSTVAGPGNDNFVAPPGTKEQGYSRNYTPAELASIRTIWAARASSDPAAIMQAMKDTGVTVKDIALASAGSGSAETLQGYNNYFTEAGAPEGFGGMYTAADMTADDKKYMEWMLAQPNGTGGTLADTYKAQKVDPYKNAGVIAQAKAQNERAARRNDLYVQSGQPAPAQYDHSGTSAGVAPWTNPTWAADQAAAAAATAARQAAQRAASPNVVVGPYTTPVASGTTGGPTTVTPPTVTPPTGTPPTVTPPTGTPPTGTPPTTGGNAYGPFNPLTSLKTPYNYSPQGIMTSQGVLTGSEKGGTTGANVSQMRDAYQNYWQNTPIGKKQDWAGGTLTRTGGAQAVYTNKDGKTYSLSPTSDLNIVAANSPDIGNQWQQEFGMSPQNYMTGSSAKAYEYLRGNGPYPVNQATPGIARPYGEMALGLPGPTFGNDVVRNQRAIDEALAAGKTGINIPAPQIGRGVISPGTYNMQTVYDPSTGQYVQNNLYTTPEQTAADIKAAAAIPSKAGGGLMALGGMTGIAGLGDYSDGGRLLRGPGDGVSDSIPAMIGNKQQARLADGEFVVPARIVSELGNGSTEAGARQLYAMMDRIQKNRSKTIGKNNVAVNSKAAKQLPA